jgi:hypothetical protein
MLESFNDMWPCHPLLKPATFSQLELKVFLIFTPVEHGLVDYLVFMGAL